MKTYSPSRTIRLGPSRVTRPRPPSGAVNDSATRPGAISTLAPSLTPKVPRGFAVVEGDSLDGDADFEPEPPPPMTATVMPTTATTATTPARTPAKSRFEPIHARNAPIPEIYRTTDSFSSRYDCINAVIRGTASCGRCPVREGGRALAHPRCCAAHLRYRHRCEPSTAP